MKRLVEMATAAQTLMMMRDKGMKPKENTGQVMEFEDVYRRYFRPLYSFVAYRVSDRAAAEDITSKVFEKALSSFSGYDPNRAALSTWLFTIARNSIIDYFRERKKHVINELAEENTASTEGNPESELQDLETRRELAAAISGLSSREHEVLALKFGAGMTNREICKLMCITETNAGTILFRSLRKLKNHLEDGL